MGVSPHRRKLSDGRQGTGLSPRQKMCSRLFEGEWTCIRWIFTGKGAEHARFAAHFAILFPYPCRNFPHFPLEHIFCRGERGESPEVSNEQQTRRDSGKQESVVTCAHGIHWLTRTGASRCPYAFVVHWILENA